jgi:hypothetical protein
VANEMGPGFLEVSVHCAKQSLVEEEG